MSLLGHEPDNLSPLIGHSSAMREVFALIRQVSHIRVNVVIYGNKGTEKELVAKAIHNCSPRADKPFLDIDCTGVAENVLESELFGHERSTLQASKAVNRGLLETSNGGTLFLDAIGDMPLTVQRQFTQVLESRRFRRIGGTQDIPVDVRIIAGTNRDLKKAVAEAAFREDLYYSLNVVPITLPDLKDRQEDIPLLANQFVQKFAQELNTAIHGISKEAMTILLSYSWPGNLRELENVIERAIAMGGGPTIQPSDLPSDLTTRAGPVEKALTEEATLEDLEREYIVAVLRRTRWHQVRAAAILGIDRRTLYRKIRQYDLKPTEE